ncbi:MAG: hypothetical protein SVT56_03410 [Chloroflexota bacterium]|nr:hypothetical protein [Chloroflexota bacterium]
MAVTQKLRKWHFLLLGGVLIMVAAFLWYWDWRSLGLPSPLQAEHCITIAVFVVGVIVLGLFIYRLNRRQVLTMLVGMVLVNLLGVLVSLWIYRTYPTFFEILRPMEVGEYDPSYVSNWRDYFLTPAVYALHISLLLLWVESLVMFLIRKPGDDPE